MIACRHRIPQDVEHYNLIDLLRQSSSMTASVEPRCKSLLRQRLLTRPGLKFGGRENAIVQVSRLDDMEGDMIGYVMQTVVELLYEMCLDIRLLQNVLWGSLLCESAPHDVHE